MRKVKILVTGAFNAGKTKFIQSVCEGHSVVSERMVTGQQASVKRLTTVALDFGRVASPRGNQLLLFGTPGQERFGFDREVLARGAHGCVLVVDCCDEGAFPAAGELATWVARKDLPLVIAANKQDRPGALAGQALRQRLGLAQEIEVIECSALQRDSVLGVLTELEGVICAKGPRTTT